MPISQALIDEIVAHSRDEYPGQECCGLIGGRDGELTSVHRARNAAGTWLRYEVHPTDQLQITNLIEDDGGEITGIYHSHTKSEAYPSQTDVNLAVNWPGIVWLICSLETFDEPIVRGFRIEDGGVEEVDLDVG